MTEKDEYYFISYAWRTREEWSIRKEKLEKGIITEHDEWCFCEKCILVHPFKWISDSRTCAGQPSNTQVALMYWKELTKEEYNIWLSTEHRSHH